MQPIFPEYIKFLNSHGCNTDWFQERTFWLDRNMVKGFKRGGQEPTPLFRIKVGDDLSVTLTEHKSFRDGLQFETWDKTIQRMLPHLRDIEVKSIETLKKHCADSGRRVINLNSTGKDSMVTTHLAKKAGIEFDTYFNVTTLDVAESNLMAKRNGYEHIYPDPQYGGFYKYIHRYSQLIPSRLNRFCCQYFKENPTVDNFDANEKLLFLFGMRNEESARRSGYEDIWVNEKWGNRDWIGVLPIRQWTEFDIWLYILLEDIEINDKYRYGYTRVGCGIACPNYTKSTWVLDRHWYPKAFTRWREIVRKDFVDNNKWLIMNCTIEEYVTKAWTGGVYRPEPTEEVIQEYAEHSGLDVEVARKYFNRYCMNGCKNKRGQPLKIKDKNALAMNMKLFGRQVESFKCKRCLMKEFGWSDEDWQDKIAAFKRQGCQLF